MFIKKLSFVFLFIVLVGTVPGTLAQSCPPGPVAADAPTIRLGVTASLSGKYSFEGSEILSGYQLWNDWVNGERGGVDVGGICYRVELIVYDDQSDPDTVSVAVESLIIDNQANFILGPYSSTLVQVASILTERENILMIEGGGSDESLFERGLQNLFGLVTPASAYTRGPIEQAFQLGARTAVIAYEETAFPAALAADAGSVLEEFGIQILAIERFPEDAGDLTALFTSFRELNPDLFVGIGYYRDTALFVRTAKALGFSPGAFVTARGPNSPAFLRQMGNDAEYLWGAAQWSSVLPYDDAIFGGAAGYADRYRSAFGSLPSDLAAGATASALALQLAVESAGTLDTDAVRTALYQLDVSTFFGPIRFDNSGASENRQVVAVQVQNGQAAIVAPSEVAFSSPIWPAPTWDER